MRQLAWVAVLGALVSTSCASCDAPSLACAADADCPVTERCTRGFCGPTAVEAGEGEGARDGEGEGVTGEGEGAIGEGEGAIGEGEGASGEGEGAAGEGEGAASEGEGEGGGCVGDGHDEDGDGVDDNCDNCPSVPNPGQEDVGELAVGLAADGVGDACDPRPAQAGDRIVEFAPFTGSALPAEWGVSQGNFGVGGDVVTSDTRNANAFELSVAFDNVNLADVAVEVVAVIDQDFGFYVAARGNSSSTNPGYSCSADAVDSALQINDGNAVLATSAVTVTTGAPHRLVVATHGSSIGCTLDGSPTVSATDFAVTAPGSASFGGFNSLTSFRSVVVYALGP